MPSTDPSAADSAADGPVDDPSAAAPLPQSFPRDVRLLNGRAYNAVFGDNRRVADRFWTVLAHRVTSDGPEPPPARLGLAIAKKRARRAVDRNRLKRVARESFRHARHALVGHHVVVLNRDAASRSSNAELRRSLDALWSRLLRQSGPPTACR